MNRFRTGDEVEYVGGLNPNQFPWRKGIHKVLDVSRKGGVKLSCQDGEDGGYLSPSIFRKINPIQENE